jgi:transcriptional regulator with PAS, ATPase and Fis domain
MIRTDSNTFVKKYLKKDWMALRKIAQATSAENPLQKVYTAIALNADGIAPDEASLKLISEIFDSPPDDSNLFMIFLQTAAGVFIQKRKDLQNFDRILKLMEELDSSLTEPELKALLPITKSEMYFATGKFTEALKSLEQAPEVPSDSPVILRITISRFRSACHDLQYELSRHELQILEKKQNKLKKYGFYSYNYFNAVFCNYFGYIEKGLKCLEASEKLFSKDVDVESILQKQLFLQMMIKHGESLKAIEFLNEWKSILSTANFKNTLAFAALARRNADDIIKYANFSLSLSETIFPLTYQYSLLLLCNAKLVSRHSAGARRILEQIDGGRSLASASMLWARLYLLENKKDTALYFSDKVCSKNIPELIQDSLRFAWELTPAQVAFLITESPNTSKIPKTKEIIENKKRVFGNQKKEKNKNCFIGASYPIEEIRRTVQKVADLNVPILIFGETGVGKEVLASLLHHQSSRASFPFIAVNCGAISDTLLASELFGHAKGAFTGALKEHKGLFEEAGKGTLFLDEITSMSMKMQASLLRVLETSEIRPVGSAGSRPVDARVVVACNEPLEEMVAQKKFRADLYFRLARLYIKIPPLRDRLSDLPLLISYFIEQIESTNNFQITDELLNTFKGYSWPGNIRELRNVIERMMIFRDDENQLDLSFFYQLLQNNKMLDTNTYTNGFLPSINNAEFNANSQVSYNSFNSSELTRLRREKLLGLFSQYERISRSSASSILKCALNTAANDLQLLEQQGVVRRVNPSTHPRMSYYTLTSASINK